MIYNLLTLQFSSLSKLRKAKSVDNQAAYPRIHIQKYYENIYDISWESNQEINRFMVLYSMFLKLWGEEDSISQDAARRAGRPYVTLK